MISPDPARPRRNRSQQQCVPAAAAHPAATTSQRPAGFAGRWPRWVVYAAGLWSLAYGLLGLYWTLGGGGFPFGVEHDPEAEKVSLLENADQDTAAPVIAAVGLAATLVAVLMTRSRPRRVARQALVGFAWALVALAVVIPDSRPLMAVARTPIVLGGMPFGWPDDVGLFEAGMFSWPVANQLLIMLGGGLWAVTALAYHRRNRNACSHCGRSDRPGGWTTPASAARWGRWAVYTAVVIPILYALTRWAWALGIPLGVTREFLREESRDTPDIWLAGAMLATVAVAGAGLTLGLVQRWGEVYPRWIPRLGGKPVRPRTAIIPASLVAVLVLTAGLHGIRAQLLGYFPEDSGLGQENWGTTAPGLLWPLWGVALGAAVLAYHLRRRGACNHCGRGKPGESARPADARRMRERAPQHRPSLCLERSEMQEKVTLTDKLQLIDDHWRPRAVATMNGYDVSLVKAKGEFVWHKHDETDDFFLVLAGHLTIQLCDRNVELDEGELFVVPRGVEHCPRTDNEASILLIEPTGTLNTGDAGGPLTAKRRTI